MRPGRRAHKVGFVRSMPADATNPEHPHPIRVLLVEDHEHVLWGLGKLIEGEWPRMSVFGTARTVPQALAAVREAAPDVVVLDLFLDEENSLDHLDQIKASGAAIVILSGSRDAAVHQRAMHAGARAVVRKDQPAEVLLREIERAHDGRFTPRDDAARQPDCPSAVEPGLSGSFVQRHGDEVMKSLALGIKRFLKEEEGASMVEYGLLAALISIVCIVAITGVGTNLNTVFVAICNALAGAVGGAGC